MEKPLRPRKNSLHRFALAQIAFKQAIALCEHMEQLSPASEAPISSAMMAGIVVTYSRPFTRGDGVGNLPASYSKFPVDSNLERYHSIMLEARNWVYAHRDHTNAQNLGGSSISRDIVDEMLLSLHDHGKYSLSINEPQIHTHQARNFRAVCAHQFNRVTEEVNSIVSSISKDYGLAPGTYKIGDSITIVS